MTEIIAYIDSNSKLAFSETTAGNPHSVVGVVIGRFVGDATSCSIWRSGFIAAFGHCSVIGDLNNKYEVDMLRRQRNDLRDVLGLAAMEIQLLADKMKRHI